MYQEKSGAISESKYWDGVGTLVAHSCVKLATDPTKITPIGHATNDRAFGIIEMTTDKQGVMLRVVVFGPVKAKAGTAGFTAGKMVKQDAAGLVEDATPTYGTEQIIGWAMESASSGNLGTIFFCKVLAAGT
jgi:hypothetical protein